MKFSNAGALTIQGDHFLINGRRLHILSGELHYPRIPCEYWRHRLKLARAMGLNTICTYLFWNLHEPQPGQFDFTGTLDVAAFIRMAWEEGLYVIVRPGPYVCAEWDFGGLPPWLLSIPDLQLRCSDPRFVEPLHRYLAHAAEELLPLQSTRGGPILMVQIENEYGSYGHDKRYLEGLQKHLIQLGFDVMLFTSDGPDRPWLRAGTLSNVLCAANFGSKPEVNIPKLKAFRPDGPMMCGEFWAGWFDHWGKSRQGTEMADGVQHAKEIAWMLENNVNLNLYMLHGGTNFGFTAGANEFDGVYHPTVTSYDYWAPVDEAGRPRPKYFAWREIFRAYQPADAILPEVPADPPRITIPQFEMTEACGLLENLPDPIQLPQPRCMEALGQHHGCILYRTDIAGLQPGKLKIAQLHDYAQIYLNEERIGTLDRRLGQDTLEIVAIPQERAQLDILVEAMGRVNFGPGLIDRKGIIQQVTLAHLVLMNWQVHKLPLDQAHLQTLRFAPTHNVSHNPGFWRGSFDLHEIGDTFLDMRGWGKGYVWINGHNLGRYWSIGPQQSLYLPGPWLRRGSNTIVVLDLEPTGKHSIQALAEPILG